MNQGEFFQANAVEVDGQLILPDDKMMAMLLLPPGQGDSIASVPQGTDTPGGASSTDTTTQTTAAGADISTTTGTTDGGKPAGTDTGTTAATPATGAKPADQGAAADAGKGATTTQDITDPKPVVLAKDGVHTIPYEQLEDARKRAQTAEAELERLRAEAEAAKAKPADTAAAAAAAAATTTGSEAATATTGTPPAVDWGDFSPEAMTKATAQIAAQAAAAAVAELQAKTASQQEAQRLEAERGQLEAAYREHYGAIGKVHPDWQSVAQSQELAAWIASKPAYLQPGYNKVLESGAAPDVVEMFTAYKAETGKTGAAATLGADKPAAGGSAPPAAASQLPAAEAAAAAAKAIQDAKLKVPAPTSLSDIPAGAGAHHDEAQALAALSDGALLDSFMGKTPQQIEAMLRRTV